MIQLTRLNHSPLIVNSDLIKFVEQSPDTVITLLNGEKLLVLESAEQIRGRIIDFRRTVLLGIPSLPDHSTVVCPEPPNHESHESREQRR